MCLHPSEKRQDVLWKAITWGSGTITCMISAIGFLLTGDWLSTAMCLGTIILVSVPFALDEYFDIKMSTAFFVFCVAYAMGPMLGKAYKLYYTTAWWDKLLHTAAGVVFCALGAYFAVRLNGSHADPILCAVFGYCFSVMVSVVWEFVEFSVDSLFATDMQHDTIVHAINSHYLSEISGGIFRIGDIQSVVLDGHALEIDGYLDIGLIDTMHDMLVETLGAAGYAIYHVVNRGKLPYVYGPEFWNDTHWAVRFEN